MISMTENNITYKRINSRRGKAQPDLVISPIINEDHPLVEQYRLRAWEKYQSESIPDSTQEAWRRTSLRGIDFTKFKLIDPKSYTKKGFPVHLNTAVAGNKISGKIQLTPVDSSVVVDPTLQEKGVIFDSLKNLVQTHPKLITKVLSRIDPEKQTKFSALVGAIDFNGVLLYVPKHITIEYPLQSVFWTDTAGQIQSLHIFIYMEEGSSATYVHESSSAPNREADSLHAGLIDVYVGAGAHLNFVELQSWANNVINFTSENVQVDRDGSVDWIFGALGSKLTKNFSNLSMIGKGAIGKMSGFYFTNGTQHLDHDTQQNHLAPNTTSDLLFKGALLENSRSVWQGMIYVAPDASKTDGYQANRNLVLSKQARADSIPGLEILTDDVRCTHGATVGKIDKEQVFYLESRGLPREEAERLIVEGFFDPIMQRIPFEGVRQRFQEAIIEKMEDKR